MREISEVDDVIVDEPRLARAGRNAETQRAGEKLRENGDDIDAEAWHGRSVFTPADISHREGRAADRFE